MNRYKTRKARAVQVSYYPGCSLEGMAAEYDRSVRVICQALGIDLVELPDWNCCGASSAHFLDDELAVNLGARNMEIAEREGRDLLVPCSACFLALKKADKELKLDTARWTDKPYAGKTKIWHINEFFDRPELIELIKQKVKRPLGGLAGVAYYGCLSQRPPKLTDARSPENPVSMDRLLTALGMELKPWSYKTDCCGASLVLTRTDIVHKLGGDLFEAAVEAGAECLVTDCPMCQSNLDTRQAEIEEHRQRQYGLPIFYLTELMALALGEAEANGWWKKHFVDPAPLLSGKGLL